MKKNNEEQSDGKYNKEHDYLKTMEEFTRKDMLLLSLHQEWVKTRYNKYDINILGYSALFLTTIIIIIAYQNSGALEAAKITATAIPLIILMGFLRNHFGVKNQINKLNGISDSINSLCKNDCKK